MKRPLPSLKGQALALLARREQSRAELRTKLLAHAKKLALAQAESPAIQADPLLAFLSPEVEARPPEPLDASELARQVDAVIEWLVTQRHQSDERFAESRIHARAGRLGQARIRQELSRHGVELDPDTARLLRETEFERAREVWRKRFPEPADDAAGRAKQMRFLAARGFAAEVVYRVVGGRDEA
ncbi:MAG: regulatory protein RecX [Vitreoscilla sp.]|nr:regulatory protein RecX [Vitreoscilla sp.]MBP6675730.1 regulatory protein RecX [Vitreoscilla sp.]